MGENAAMTPEDKPTPDYAPPPRLAWIGRHRKVLICLAILIAIATPLFRYRKPLMMRVHWLYAFHQAMAFQMPTPPVEEVRIETPSAATVPTTRPQYTIYTYTSGNFPGRQMAIYTPGPLRELRKYDPRLSFPGADETPMLFMGMMKRPDGMSRFVTVSGGRGYTVRLLLDLFVTVLPEPKWLDPRPQASQRPGGSGFGSTGPAPIPTQCKTGTLDPADPTHLVFEFIAGREGASPTPQFNPPRGEGIIDAYLQNDDSLLFRIRSVTNVRGTIDPTPASRNGDPQKLLAEAKQQEQTRAAARTAATQPGARSSSRGGRSGTSRGPTIAL